METNKLILACLITLCSLPVAAQVKLGIEAGANLSNYITDSHSNPSDSKNMKVGFQAGLTVDYEFQNHLMLMSGLFFVRKGGNLKLGENYYGIPLTNETIINVSDYDGNSSIGFNLRFIK